MKRSTKEDAKATPWLKERGTLRFRTVHGQSRARRPPSGGARFTPRIPSSGSTRLPPKKRGLDARFKPNSREAPLPPQTKNPSTVVQHRLASARGCMSGPRKSTV